MEENIFYQTVLTRYFQERLLYRISQTRYRKNFYLKGCALMYAYDRFAARPTLDIDFLGNNISNEGASRIIQKLLKILRKTLLRVQSGYSKTLSN